MRFLRLLAGFGVLLLVPVVLAAERLPVRTYTTADGLAGDGIQAIRQDSRGFLWVGTSTGLSRFDGAAWTSYGARHGLPHVSVTVLLEGRDGTLWVGTSDGLARLRRRSGPGEGLFEIFRTEDREARSIRSLAEDRRGNLWVGTNRGLLVFQEEGGRLHRPGPTGLLGEAGIGRIIEDAEGSLWLGTSYGLFRRLPDGLTIRYLVWPEENAGSDWVEDLHLDRSGLLWVIHARGLFVLRPVRAGDEGPERLRWLVDPLRKAAPLGGRGLAVTLQAGQASFVTAWRGPSSVCEVEQGPLQGLWISSLDGLLRLERGRLQRYGPGQGLPETGITALAPDDHGNLWAGTGSRGLVRVAGLGLGTYGPADGLREVRIGSVFESRQGELMIAGGLGGMRLYRFDAGRFEDVTPPSLAGRARQSWGWGQIVVHDVEGGWWMPTGEGLLRFPPARARDLPRTAPAAVYTRRDGLPGQDIFRLYEDSRGDLWISVLDAALEPLGRWQRSTARFETVLLPRGLPRSAPTAFAEDRAGNLWIGFYTGGLARWRNGELRALTAEDGIPEGFIHDLHVDRQGRLWVASGGGGLARADDPAAARPRFRIYTSASDRLSSDSVRSLGEDLQGRILLGTARGVDRLDPGSGTVESYTTGDGLAATIVPAAFRDRWGHLWFGTLEGLSRLDPRRPAEVRPPRVVISAVRIAGVPWPVSELGARTLEGLELAPGQSRLQIDFAGLSLAPGAGLLYRTRLAEIDPAWSAPGTARTALYAGLPPGRYRFMVRAVTAGGVESREPAVVAFRVLPPVWRRWWFLLLAGTAMAAAAWSAHRYRVARLLALERMRTRVASDLHDDLGGSLSRMAVLSEVGKLRLGGGDVGEAAGLFGEIGDTARELSEAMSDIVWSIDPRCDDLESLLARLRRFASDLLEGRGIAFRLDAPPEAAGLHLAPAQRREIFLILKEAVHNASRHARPSAVSVCLEVRGRDLIAEVRDDGAGFRIEEVDGRQGRGLRNLRMRAGLLGGDLTLDAAPGQGTRVSLRVPLRKLQGT